MTDARGDDGGTQRPPVTIAVRLTPDGLRQVRGGHPWIFDGSIRSARPSGELPVEATRAGDLAVVFDDRRRFVAVGLWDPYSPIRVRVLQSGDRATIDRDWFRSRLDAASDLRTPLAADATTTGYRLVNGEGDGLPGLVLDRYDDTLVLKAYTAAWFPHLPAVLDAVVGCHRPRRVVLRVARVIRDADPSSLGLSAPPGARLDGLTLLGDEPRGPVVFREHGLAFEADVVRGQKTGFFLDQRDNRARVRELSRGARVLDVFSCTGGFSVNAAAGGATEVHSVDISAAAIEATARNLGHNAELAAVRACRRESSTGDASEVMARLRREGRRFDVVVVDPPSFASKQRQVAGALRAYGRLTERALALLRPGGTLVQASCSARVGVDDFVDAVSDAALRSGRSLAAPEVTGHGIDHPVGFEHGRYLKAIIARVERAGR